MTAHAICSDQFHTAPWIKGLNFIKRLIIPHFFFYGIPTYYKEAENSFKIAFCIFSVGIVVLSCHIKVQTLKIDGYVCQHCVVGSRFEGLWRLMQEVKTNRNHIAKLKCKAKCKVGSFKILRSPHCYNPPHPCFRCILRCWYSE